MKVRATIGRSARRAAAISALALLVLAPVGCDRAAPAPSAATASAADGATSPRGAPFPSSSSSPSASTSSAGLTTGEAAGVQYIEVVTGRADPASELPLVMAIHGLGDRPESFSDVLAGLDEPARLIFPRGLTAYHGGFSWFPSRGGFNDEALKRGVVTSAQALAKALEAITKARPTRGRPIVTGFSQGGALSFAIAVLHPTSIAAAIPVGGWVAFPLPKEAPPAPRPPITALHGADDRLIPVAPTRTSVSDLRALGFAAELREFPGVGHAIPEPMRRELLGLVSAALRAATGPTPPAAAPSQ